MHIHIKIKRFNPETDQQPWWGEYELNVDPLDRVLDLLTMVKEHHDPGLAFRHSCAHGICGSDAMLINQRNALACKTLVKQVGAKIVVEPLPGLTVQRDLMVDLEEFYAKYRAMLPFMMDDGQPPEHERLQSPAEHHLIEDATKCILCGSCISSCPSFWANEQYFGPAAILQAYRFINDSRDQAWDQRLEIINRHIGVWSCRLALNCFQCCPRHIDLPRHISELKMSLLSGEL